MKWISTIKEIGTSAISEKDRTVILFGQTANDELRKVSVIQEFDDEEAAQGIVLKKGDTITIDGQTLIISAVGSMAISNLRALGHVSLFFADKLPKKPMSNAVYLELDGKDSVPTFRIDDEIVYEHL
ncbi:MAG: PTS glucitol/sorbitol transporter subunit IIA [Lactobacillus equicursoris]|uniref:PTS glucitol/sorbitol transporter subunit IIA n=1 Tax=Lactobacillus equicursoris TaxID=420645 RepID=UPI002431DB5C|nr:PTS glucitol/sorbitol transporter subunit IIA [Lactobacillus equicursoris]MDD6407330.1 PTS glucitol/sorbitol transporter subunit IIA [Lactobacillus equicursoris]